jgi:ATP-binding cassette subfamily F protein uup
VGKLSGGERRRLYLVTRLLRDPNFLVLDEPTNDLDLATLEALEDFLDGFGGCLLVISHDRYFLDRTVDRVFAPTGGGHWKLYPGSYTVYARMREEEEAEAAEARAAAREKEARRAAAQISAEPKAARNGPRKLSYKEQRELEQIEAEIPQLEQRIEALNGEIGSSGRDYEKLRALTEEQGQLTARLETAMARWEELLALAGS